MNPTLKVELIVCLTDHTWMTADIQTILPEIELAEEGVLLNLLLKSGWWKGSESGPVEIAFVGIYHIEEAEDQPFPAAANWPFPEEYLDVMRLEDDGG